jgi:ribose/xylose/arabinose/galactoside ABC-type transport system permease subunit
MNRRAGEWLSTYAIFVALVLECLVLAIATDSFFTVDNLSNVLRQNAFTAILAAGMTFVILTAGIDRCWSASRSARSTASPSPDCACRPSSSPWRRC